MSPSAKLDDARRALDKRRRESTSRPIRSQDVLDRYKRGEDRGTKNTRPGTPGAVRPVKGDDKTGIGRPGGRPLAPVKPRPTKGTPRDPGTSGRPVRPGADRPTVGRPGADRPNAGRPNAGRPIADRPGSSADRPHVGGPGGRPRAIGGGKNPLATDRDAAARRYKQRLENARPIGAGGSNRGPIEVVPGAPNRPDSRGQGARPPRPSTPNGGRTQVGSWWNGAGTWGGPNGYYNSCFWNTWGGYYGNTWGNWACSPFYLSGFWWDSYWRCGGRWGFGQNWRNGFWSPLRSTYWYGPTIPSAVSVVVYDDPDPEPDVIYIESEPDVIYVDGANPGLDVAGGGAPAGPARPVPIPSVPSGGSAAAAPVNDKGTDPGLQRELNRAAAYYLTQGDRAFRETRYGDAVHAYAKAVEFAPESGILYLVLSDALFATGDYRYAAFALRQAGAREPELFENVVDKRAFYSEPGEFDGQLELLERFVRDHVLDVDARLVLAANYLFGGRPELSQDVLENPFSEELRGTELGDLLLRVSRREAGEGR